MQWVEKILHNEDSIRQCPHLVAESLLFQQKLHIPGLCSPRILKIIGHRKEKRKKKRKKKKGKGTNGRKERKERKGRIGRN